MTEELFRADAYLRDCDATVTAVHPGAVEVDRTVFYPTGGGQPGDTGRIVGADGVERAVVDTRKGEAPGAILHVLAPEAAPLAIGDRVTLALDWERRHRLMRMHTCLHLLCAVVPSGVTGGAVGDGKGRLDFDLGEASIDKEDVERRLNAMIADDAAVAQRWITDEELSLRPDLVRTMSVKPPTGLGRVRLMEVAGIDLQPCGGTHVARIAEIGPIRVEKIESKGKRNRRIQVVFAT
jgi:misacylated tRNA(Ala) deacylase